MLYTSAAFGTQASVVIPNSTGAQLLVNINNAFGALVSNNSGASAPSTTYAGMPWLDTSTSPTTYRIRNSVNTGWITIGTLSDVGSLFQAANSVTPWIDARAYSTLALADTAAIAAGKTLLISSSWTVSADTTLSSPIQMINRGAFNISSGKILSIAGPFSAGQYQVFAGTGTVTFGAATSKIDPSWWYDGGGNWASAINAAIQSASVAQMVDLPAGTLTLKGTGTELILFDHSLKMQGKGVNSTILSLSVADVGATTDAIHVAPNMAYGWGGGGLGMELSDFTITPSDGSTPTGRYGINLDTSTNATQIIADSVIQRVFVYPLNNAAIYQKAYTTSGTNPGYFNSTIRDCMLWGGITATNFGDSNRIEDNFFRGAGYGFNITLYPGVALTHITGNVSTSASGCIVTDKSGTNPINGALYIVNNQFEKQVTNTGADGSLLTVRGATSNPILAPTITDNKFYDSVNATASYLLLDNVSLAKVSQNLFAIQTPATQASITTTATCKSNDLRENTYVDSTYGFTYLINREMATNTTPYTANIADSGVATLGLPKVITLLNSWAAYDITPTRQKDSLDTVRLDGQIYNGTATDATELFVLPVGYRPANNISLIVPASANTGYINVELRFTASTGSVKLYGVGAATIAYIDLNGISFKTDPNF